MAHQTSPEMQGCIDACQSCHAVCLSEAVNHCLEMGGAHAAHAHIRIMLDCAQMCATSVDFMARNSAHHTHVCGLCADICAACAVSCEQVGGMDACIAACRACEASCRKMAGMAR